MRYVVTITDNIGQSNMPFHEFACFRKSHFFNEIQVVFVMGKENNDSLIPSGLDVRHVGTNLRVIKYEVKKVLSEVRKSNATVIFHVHEAKSVIRLFLASGAPIMKKTIFTVHSTFSGYPFKNKVMALVASFMSNVVTCVSNTSYAHFPTIVKRIKKNRVIAVQNGVDIERIKRIKSEKADAPMDVTLLGRVKEVKLLQP